MVSGEHILVPVEGHKAMHHVVDYVGAVIAGRAQVAVHLFHRLPALPPQLREHGGSENSEDEARLRAELERNIQRWISEQEEKCRLVLNEMHDRLTKAGVSADAIYIKIGQSVFADEELGETLYRVANELDCRTIVLPYEHAPAAVRNIFRGQTRRRPAGDASFVVWLVG